jgi:hypothetical protein
MGLYLVGGPEVIRPHRERYGMSLVVPTIVVISCLISSLIPEAADVRSRVVRLEYLAVVSAGCWGLLYSFHVNYFNALRTTGGQSHLAFRAADVEPKQQAWELILADLSHPRAGDGSTDHGSTAGAADRAATPRGPVTPVIAENWWLFWPLRFLASREQQVVVSSLEDLGPQPGSSTLWHDRLQSDLSSGGYAVAFADGELEEFLVSTFPWERLCRWEVRDYAGRPAISVFRVQPQ